MALIGDFLGGLSRCQRLTLAALTTTALVWHQLLPAFMDGGVYIEGPLPAIAGAAVGLRMTRGEDQTTQTLATCAAATLGEWVAVAVLGLALYGVKRRWNGTPDRRAKGTPLPDGGCARAS